MTVHRLFVLVTALALTAPLACTLGGDIDEVGESCRADGDCSDDFECVPADSPNASRVCMPITG